MQIRLFHLGLLKPSQGLITFVAAVCLICVSLAQGASQLTNTKRITAVQLGDSPEGSRVTVTGDSLLDDYEAFRRGDRFYVRIPSADFVAANPRFQGLGFEDVQVQKVGDSVVISFRLHPGTNARVIGAANRLEVIFTSPNHFASNDGATAVRNRVTRNTSGDKPSRSVAKSGSDVAGPMPPESPNTTFDYSDPSGTGASAPRSRSAQAEVRTSTSNAGVPAATPTGAATPAPVATPYASTSPYSATYPPASVYTPAPVQPVTQPSNQSSGLEARARAALLWARENKIKSAAAGVTLMALLGMALFLMYRRRRNRRAAMAKAARVQPKTSPADELEDMIEAKLSSDIPTGNANRFVDQDAYQSWGESASDDLFFEDLTANTNLDVASHEVVAPTPNNSPSEGSWEYIPESNPQAYKSRVQEEREVFEL